MSRAASNDELDLSEGAEGDAISAFGGAGGDAYVAGDAADLMDGGDGAVNGVTTTTPEPASTSPRSALAKPARARPLTTDRHRERKRVELADVLGGDAETNTLRGEDGDDLIVGLGGFDVLDGGDGIDIVGYVLSPEGVRVDLFGTHLQRGRRNGRLDRRLRGRLGQRARRPHLGRRRRQLVRGGGSPVRARRRRHARRRSRRRPPARRRRWRDAVRRRRRRPADRGFGVDRMLAGPDRTASGSRLPRRRGGASSVT